MSLECAVLAARTDEFVPTQRRCCDQHHCAVVKRGNILLGCARFPRCKQEYNVRRSPFIAALLLFTLSEVGFARHVNLHGFVTAVHSPLNFEMDQYQIVDRTQEERDRIRSEGRDYQPPHLKPGVLRVGLEVEVKGEYDVKTGEVKATAIKAVNDEFEADKFAEGMGLVEDKASLQKNSQGWSGRLTA